MKKTRDQLNQQAAYATGVTAGSKDTSEAPDAAKKGPTDVSDQAAESSSPSEHAINIAHAAGGHDVLTPNFPAGSPPRYAASQFFSRSLKQPSEHASQPVVAAAAAAAAAGGAAARHLTLHVPSTPAAAAARAHAHAAAAAAAEAITAPLEESSSVPRSLSGRPAWPPALPSPATMHHWGMLGQPPSLAPDAAGPSTAAAAAAAAAGIPAASLPGLPLLPTSPGLLLGAPLGAAPAPASLAKRKAGRPKAPNPLDDPNIPEKRARRIMANRESADRSKKRQRLAQAEAQARQEELKQHLRSVCKQIDDTHESLLVMELVQSAVTGTPAPPTALASLQQQLQQQKQQLAALGGTDPQLLLAQIQQQQQQQEQQQAYPLPLQLALPGVQAPVQQAPVLGQAVVPAAAAAAAAGATQLTPQHAAAAAVTQPGLPAVQAAGLQPLPPTVLPAALPAQQQQQVVLPAQPQPPSTTAALLLQLLGLAEQQQQQQQPDAASQPRLLPQVPFVPQAAAAQQASGPQGQGQVSQAPTEVQEVLQLLSQAAGVAGLTAGRGASEASAVAQQLLTGFAAALQQQQQQHQQPQGQQQQQGQP